MLSLVLGFQKIIWVRGHSCGQYPGQTASAKKLSLPESKYVKSAIQNVISQKLHGQPLTHCSRYPLGRKLVNLYDFISSIQKDFFLLCADLLSTCWGAWRRLSTAEVATVILRPPYIVLVIIARLNSQSVYYMREPS